MIRRSDPLVAADRVAVAEATTARAVTALRALVAQLERIGGYTTPAQQQELREARAVLAEVGQ